jgi:hypothetical protein
LVDHSLHRQTIFRPSKVLPRLVAIFTSLRQEMIAFRVERAGVTLHTPPLDIMVDPSADLFSGFKGSRLRISCSFDLRGRRLDVTLPAV